MAVSCNPDNASKSFNFVDELEALIPQMRAFARSLCRDVTKADDLVQEACLSAWGAMDGFDASKPMRPWLFRIIRNQYYQDGRKSWRNVYADADEIASALTTECDLEIRSEFTEMSNAIYTLPNHQRDALILVVAAGYTYDEAGEICDCSGGTIKSRVSRARAAVKATLEYGTTSLSTLVIDGGLQEMSGVIANRIDELTAIRKVA